MNFKSGDVVQHKTNEIKMVVIREEDGYQGSSTTRIYCKYWNPNSFEFETKQFHPFELCAYSEKN